MSITPERHRQYQENRRNKYKSDPDWRAHILASNRAHRLARKEEINAKRRHRWASDHAYREKQLAPRRGRCQRREQLKVHYGITLEDYNRIYTDQGGACAICGAVTQRALCVDHCHASGNVRGLLCRKCNTGLGCYNDSPDLMLKAIAYLGKYHVDQ